MKSILAIGLFLAPLSIPSISLGYDPRVSLPLKIEELSRTAEEPESIKDFFKDRTRLSVGLEEAFNSNLFLQDNNPQEDFTSALEARLLFADPRGSLLYGFSYIVDAVRFHRKDANAIDHRPFAFLDYDPGGRFQYRLEYKLDATNHLILGPQEIDILRRNAGFQREVRHAWETKLDYSLNETNALVPQVRYLLFDDQAVSDAETDRRILEAIVDVDHDLRPDWVLFGGYGFSDITLPGSELKSSESHGIRLGIRHELTQVSDVDVTLKFDHREWRSEQQKNYVGVVGKWTYQLGPRTTLLFGYTDERLPSYAAGRLQFRSTRPSLQATYALSPLTELTLGASYEKQRSGGRDVLTGNPTTTVVTSRYRFSAGIKWQCRENVHVTGDYIFDRSKTNDYTNHLWAIAVKAQL